MASLVSENTLDTQKPLASKRKLLSGESQAEVEPPPPFSNDGQACSHAMDPPLRVAAQTTSSNGNTYPPFTFTSETLRRARQSEEHISLYLAPSKSSPISSLANDERVIANKMHHSFAGFPDNMGDTQPMDTQTFVAHSDLGLSRSILEMKADTIDGQYVIADSEAIRQAERRVDLALNGQNNMDDDEDEDVSSLLSDAEELSPETTSRLQAETAALFKVPKTPATISKKRNRRGELISSEVRTSSTRPPRSTLKAIFGNHVSVNGISMTQLFQNTQDASSPDLHALQSDPVFERPSPNLNFQHTSPRHTYTSSPTRPSTSDGTRLARMHLEPVCIYRTSKESQESRAKRLREEEEQRMKDNLGEEDNLEDSFDSTQKRDGWKRTMQNAISAIDLTAPRKDRSESHRSKRSKSMDNFSSDRIIPTSVIKASKLRSFSPEPLSEDIGDRRMQDAISNLESKHDDDHDIQVPMTSSKPQRKANVDPSQQPSPSSSQQPEFFEEVATQGTIAVQDSQSEILDEAVELHGQASRGVQSSAISNLRVIQSQYSSLTSLTSETKALISQHMRNAAITVRPIELPDTAPATADEEIPSSPPVHFSEHDHEYDEDFVKDVECLNEGEIEIGEEKAIDAENEVDLLPSVFQNACSSSLTHQTSLVHSEEPLFLVPVENADTLNGLLSSQASQFAVITAPSKQTATTTGAGTEIYDTAETSRTQPATDGLETQQAPSQQVSELSPIKRLTDIALSPRRSGESIDLDFVDNMVSDGEKEIRKLLSGSSPVRPSKKARFLRRRSTVLREPSLNENLAKTIQTFGGVASDVFSSPKQSEPLPSPSLMLIDAEPQTLATTHGVEELALQEEHERPMEKIPTKAHKTNSHGKLAALRTNLKNGQGKNKSTNRKARKTISSKVIQVSNLVHVDSKSMASQRYPNDAGTPKLNPTHPEVRNDHTASANQVSAPMRILALFKDARLYYYPATYIDSVFSDGEKYKVRFDDNTVTLVEPMQVRRLDLSVGDIVKVDLNGLRKGTYIIQGFADVSMLSLNNHAQDEDPPSDAFGNQAVRLVSKISDSSTRLADQEQPLVVPVSSIYLTGQMLSAFADRRFTPPTKPVNRASTPLAQISEPTTPGSRSRRFTMSMYGHRPELATYRESELFSNMLFAVTFVNDQPGIKDEVVKLISSHGGGLLDQGFDDIFTPEASTPTSPSKSPLRSTISDGSDSRNTNMRLRASAQHLGFTAFISDRHCRKEKYLQALALGIPCLHYRWLKDCIKATKIVPFDCYLLPAGESEFINNAVRSRTLTPYNPLSTDASLQSVLDRRPLPFDGANILFIMSAAEKKKAYKFLVCAAGAANVRFVRDLLEAKKYLENNSCEWVICDGEKEKARDTLLVSKVNGNSKKRKRNSDQTKPTTAVCTTVVDCEFVVQSLILSALADQ